MDNFCLEQCSLASKYVLLVPVMQYKRIENVGLS